MLLEGSKTRSNMLANVYYSSRLNFVEVFQSSIQNNFNKKLNFLVGRNKCKGVSMQFGAVAVDKIRCSIKSNK